MRLSKSIATLSASAMLAAAALVAVSTPASATDEGSLLPGGIYWFSAPGPLAGQSAATQLTSGANAVNRPWVSLTTVNPCPAGTLQADPWVRIPTAGLIESDWPQVTMSTSAEAVDADGRFYTTEQPDRLNKSEIITYNAAHGGTGTFPFIFVCRDADANSLGYFRTEVTVTGTTDAGLSWSIVSPAYTGGGSSQTATTTTLTAAPAGANLLLTAAVAPAAAGQVTFKDGSTVLSSATVTGGTATYTVIAPITQGSHRYVATFVPTDAAAYSGSEGTKDVTIGLDAATGQITLDVPAAPVVDGSLVFTVPFNTPVALTGARTADNSRITAAGAFPTVTVTDTRRDGLLAGWEVNAQASDFTGTAGTIGAKYLGWTPATPTLTPDVAGGPLMAQAGPTVTSNLDSGSGLAVSSLLGKSTVNGRGATVLGAALNLAIPASSPAGTYTSTVTVTLVAN